MGVPHTFPPSDELGPPVALEGAEPFELTPEAIESFDAETRSVTVVCASGDRHTAEWTGIAMPDLLEAADVPLSSTHVVVESLDDYRVVIPVRAALQGLLAFAKDGQPIGRTHEYGNRFVSGAAEGARFIKGVRRIEATTVDPDENPERLENLFPDGERFTAHRYDGQENAETDQTQ